MRFYYDKDLGFNLVGIGVLRIGVVWRLDREVGYIWLFVNNVEGFIDSVVFIY